MDHHIASPCAVGNGLRSLEKRLVLLIVSEKRLAFLIARQKGLQWEFVPALRASPLGHSSYDLPVGGRIN